MYLYIFQIGTSGLCKIGVTSTLTRRKTEVQCRCGQEIRDVWYIEADYETCTHLERVLHRQWADRRTYGEFFSLSFEDAVNFASILERPPSAIDYVRSLLRAALETEDNAALIKRALKVLDG